MMGEERLKALSPVCTYQDIFLDYDKTSMHQISKDDTFE